jgi:signal transduction histidine kinase/F0F1-type ATP synthase assembly protein I
VSRWRLAWLAALAGSVALGTEWMRAPGWVFAGGVTAASVLALAAALLTARRSPGAVGRTAGAALAVALAVAAVGFTARLSRLRDDWPAVRERAVTRASRRLELALHDAAAEAREVADRAARVIGTPGAAAFQPLAPLARSSGAARGVVLFDGAGSPTAWAGTLRVPLNPSGPDLSTVTTPFYLWLVARRQAPGGTAVAAVLLARATYAPMTGVALTDRFAGHAGMGLRFYQPEDAPAGPDVFDFVVPEGTGRDTLFAVQTVPPEQDAAIADALGTARRTAFWLVLALLLVGMAGAVRSGEPAVGVAAMGGAAALFIARAPLAEAFGSGSLFGSATYYQDVLGPYSTSAGKVLLTGVAVALLASALWRRGFRPGWPHWLLALGVTVLAPYLLQDLARGITPPASGVTLALWLLWQATLVLAASALVLVAAALVRGPAPPARAGVWPFLAALLAVALAVAGLFLWEPRGAWPEWYPYLWLPALLVAIKPMPFRSTIATVAVVAGSAAALLEWGTTAESRIALATRDMEGLGDRPDALKVALFDRLVDGTPPSITPLSVGDLYLLWRRSDFSSHGYPAELSLWTKQGERDVELDLAELDLPDTLVRAQVRETLRERLPLVRSYDRVPGVFGLATIPLNDGHVVAVAVGPQSSLISPSRVARFLTGSAEAAEPSYQLTLSPLEPRGPPSDARASWARDGWTIRGERVVDLPGGRRHVHAQVELGGLSDVLQRGLLLLVLDFGVLALLWLGMDLIGGRFVPNLQAWLPRVTRSLRARLTVSLAAFFVLPTVVFALWSYGRQADEFRRSRELLIDRTLQDAGAALEPDSSRPGPSLEEDARRVDAELALSEGGVLQTTSAPVLADLGLLDWLLPPAVYRALTYGDEVELARPMRDAPQPVLAGYLLLRPGAPGRASVLSSLQPLSDQALAEREKDVSIAVLVAAVLGIAAALVLSGFAARALARPLRDLAQAALAAGAGARPAPATGGMPSELEPVYRAIAQAAADVERGQQAQRVLAWGEMARQVAHEIKNPLTPIRLGIQHLMRLERERPAELGAAVDGTGQRILTEIDRLDAIARAFSRFALPGAERPPVEPVPVGEVAREVVGLYRLGATPVRWDIEIGEATVVVARRDELAEVLVNLFENARDAGARRVVVRAAPGATRPGGEGGAGASRRVVVEVEDDGRGIPGEALPRVFEPRFSTTTSGSGLGLAIAKRLVEGWGGSIAIASTVGAGTTVTLDLAGPAPPAPA